MDHARLDNDSPARASLLGMPLEIKMTIVRMARDQDDRYRAARTRDAEGLEKTTMAAVATGWHGRSLSALFLTSKELSELAAVWLFESLKSSRVLHSTFQYLVAGRRACHVRSIAFEADGRTVASKDAALDSLAYILSRGVTFSKLSQMIIKPSSILSLLIPREGVTLRDSLRTAYVRTNFRIMAARIQRVEFLGVSADDATGLLDYFPSMQDIELTLDEDSDGLRDALSARVELRTLTLRHPGYSTRSRTWAEWHSTSPTPSLTSLTFDVFRISQNDLDFVEGFASSLQRLEIRCDEAAEEAGDNIGFTSLFPYLHTIVLKTSLSGFTLPFLSSLSAPDLKSLSFATDRYHDNLDIEFDDDSFILNAIQRSAKSLRFLELLPPETLYASERKLLTSFCDKNNLALNEIPSCGIPFYDLEGGEDENDEDDHLGWRAVAECTLAFGVSHLDRVSLDEDQVGLAQLLRALGGLEAARILWRE